MPETAAVPTAEAPVPAHGTVYIHGDTVVMTKADYIYVQAVMAAAIAGRTPHPDYVEHAKRMQAVEIEEEVVDCGWDSGCTAPVTVRFDDRDEDGEPVQVAMCSAHHDQWARQMAQAPQ